VDCDGGAVRTPKVVIATGGLPVPKIGASDYGLRLAQGLGHRIVTPRPALVPLTFDTQDWAPFAGLAGLSLEVEIALAEAENAVPQASGGGKRKRELPMRFLEDLLFTHRGLSGPAILQISSYWQAGRALRINLAPQTDLRKTLIEAKRNSRRLVVNELTQYVPNRLAQTWLNTQNGEVGGWPLDKSIADWRDADLHSCAALLQAWQLTPSGDEGWRKAEVMAGGVDTRDLQSRSMESRLVSGLYFIGEVVDVTGWLGGYNFQWAWASAAACARALIAAQG
jgi:predicted Rossmann fold flavoprotein